MNEAVPVEILALVPTHAGCAVFLGNPSKAILFHIDPAIASSINAATSGQPAQRPLTHDLYMSTLEGFGAKVTRIVINKVEGDVFYARIIVTARNEIMERKIIELDARPSDSLAIAARAGAPVFIAADVWKRLENRRPLLEEMQSQNGSIDFGDLDV